MQGLSRLVAGIALFGAAAMAQADIVTLEPTPGHGFREVIGEPRPVSSTSVVGALALRSGNGDERFPGSDIYAFFPDGSASGDRIQIEMESADGVYRGQGEFHGQVPAQSWARLRLLDQNKTFQWPSTAHWTDIAVSIHRITQAPTERSTRLIASIEANPESSDMLRLHINSRGARIVSKGSKECFPVHSPSVVAFDHVCQVPLGQAASADGKPAQIHLLRLEGFSQDDIFIDLPTGLLGAAGETRR